MGTERRERLLASHAMWARDYKGALEFYTKFLQSGELLDSLSLYKINFELAIASTILKKRANAYLEKLEETFRNMERTLLKIRERTQMSIREIRSLITERFDRENIENLLREYFPRDGDVLAFFISPRYARRFLRTALRNAEMCKVPQVLKAGIFKYTLSSELYCLIGRAYSIQELELERLRRFKPVKVLITNPNVYYVEDENLRTIAAIQRDGLVLCQYALQSSQDTTGAEQIHAFLQNLSQVFSIQ